MIVDDEKPIRELLARWVESLNLQACLASTAEEAVATLDALHCDLAIIDIMMQTGMLTTKAMRIAVTRSAPGKEASA